MDINIRNIQYDDLKIVKLLNESILSENYPIKLWEYWIEKYKKYSFVALYNDVIIGYIICDNNKIISLAVKENYRHLGIGTKLLTTCLSVIKSDIYLHCRKSNNIALKFYEKYGFIIKKKLLNFYNFPKDNAYLLCRKYKKIDIITLDSKSEKEKLKKELLYIN